MNRQLRHVIVTRFNLKSQVWRTTKNNEPLQTQAWLRHRFELFEQYCLPSVQNQTNQNFEWFVYFDTETPPEFLSKINHYAKSYGNFKPVFLEDIELLKPHIKAHLQQNTQTPYLLTTRLDNDDSLHQTFVQTINDCAQNQISHANNAPETPLLIDVTHGFMLDTQPKMLLGNCKMPFNPFMSLLEAVEPNNEPITIYHQNQEHWTAHPNCLKIANKRLWLQVIHEKNKLNKFSPSSLNSNLSQLTNFGIAPQNIAEPQKWLGFVQENAIVRQKTLVLNLKIWGKKMYCKTTWLLRCLKKQNT